MNLTHIHTDPWQSRVEEITEHVLCKEFYNRSVCEIWWDRWGNILPLFYLNLKDKTGGNVKSVCALIYVQ